MAIELFFVFCFAVHRFNVICPQNTDIMLIFFFNLFVQSVLLFSTGQNLGASTVPVKESGTGPVTQSPVQIIYQLFERCCAVSLTLCLTTMSSTSGSLWQTHVSTHSLKYARSFIFKHASDHKHCQCIKSKPE